MNLSSIISQKEKYELIEKEIKKYLNYNEDGYLHQYLKGKLLDVQYKIKICNRQILKKLTDHTTNTNTF